MPPTPATTTASHPAFWRSTFEEHGGAVLGFLISRVGRRDLAEDLLQETFVKAIRAGALRDPAKVRSYLLSVAHRLVIDHVRRRRPVLFSEMDDEGGAGAPEPGEGAGAEERVDRQRVAERLREAVDALSEPLRIAFEGAVLAERPYAEIAAENGWAPRRVRVNVHRARKRVIAHLRDLLQVDTGESP